MVPEGWNVSTVGQHTSTVMGFAFRSEDFVDCGVPLIRMGNLYQNELDLGRRPAYLPSTFLDEYMRFSVNPGDLVMSMTGTLGKRDYGFTVMVPSDFDTCLLNQRVMKINPRRSVDLRFIMSLLRSEVFLNKLYSLPGGTKQANLSAAQVKGIEFICPPLPEQRKIAEILSTWDRAIEVSEALLTTARTQKRALMQSLLTGNRRFPEFEGQPWREVRLGEMGKTVSGGTPDSTVPEYWDGDVHWATPTDITKLTSRFIRGTARMITQAGLKSSAAKLAPAGSVLICTRATIGQMAIATGPICTNQGFKNLTPSKKFDSDYIYYMLEFFKNELIRYACGSTFLELSKKDFDTRAFRMPEINEQRRISAVLNACEEEIDEHRQNIEKMRIEKSALMQQLLTGKRRVVVGCAFENGKVGDR
jgi:type I restriction enzyme S subunit